MTISILDHVLLDTHEEPQEPLVVIVNEVKIALHDWYYAKEPV